VSHEVVGSISTGLPLSQLVEGLPISRATFDWYSPLPHDTIKQRIITMRRKNEQDTNGNGAGRIKFRVIEIEVDGANDTLAEGIKALTLALSKGATSTVTPRALPAPKRAAGPVTDAAPVEEPEIEEEILESEKDETEESNAAVARPKRAPYVPRTPNILNDVDFNTGNVSLKDYVAKKNPSDNYDRYLTIAVWYKENKSIDEVDDDRIYTAYRFLDWPAPNDVAQVLRDAKAKKKWFDKVPKGGYKINIIGINRVHSGF
jgi:hypothetical protein